jgi:hypothetical protein
MMVTAADKTEWIVSCHSTGATTILIVVVPLLDRVFGFDNDVDLGISKWFLVQRTVSVCVLSCLILKTPFVCSFLIYATRTTSFVSVSPKYLDDVEIPLIQSFENCVSSISRWGWFRWCLWYQSWYSDIFTACIAGGFCCQWRMSCVHTFNCDMFRWYSQRLLLHPSGHIRGLR